MPAFNRAATIGPALASVLGQTYRDLELLVVDDGSTDGTAQVVERFAAHDQRVRLIKLAANEGRSAARNHALDAARGEFVTFLDSDDLFAPARLERLVAAAGRFPGDDIFIDDNLQFAFRDGRVVIRSRSVYPSGVAPGRPRPVWVEGYVCWSAASKLFLRRSLVEFLHVRFPTELAQAEDYVVMLQVMFEGRPRRVIRVAESLYWYRRPYEDRREAGWLLEQGHRALTLAQERAASEKLNEMAPRLRQFMERNPDDGDPKRRFDPRRFTKERVVFAWCFLWARILDTPGRDRVRQAIEQALALDEPEQH
jgi:glycosyltransferase involved in cell wall biosynthesis